MSISMLHYRGRKTSTKYWPRISPSNTPQINMSAWVNGEAAKASELQNEEDFVPDLNFKKVRYKLQNAVSQFGSHFSRTTYQLPSVISSEM